MCAALCCGITGCNPSAESKDKVKPKSVNNNTPIEFVIIDDAPLGEVILRQLKAQSEGEVTIKSYTVAEFRALEEVAGDLIIYPSWLIGELAEKRVIEPVSKVVLGNEEFESGDILRLDRGALVEYARKKFAVSMGSPVMMLHFRQDIFGKEELLPPADWAEYQKIVESLAEKNAAANSKIAPTLEPMAKGWASEVLFTRVAASIRHHGQYSSIFDINSLKPVIDREPFVNALEQMVMVAKLAKEAGYDCKSLTRQDVQTLLLDGKAAMGITWASRLDSKRPESGSSPQADPEKQDPQGDENKSSQKEAGTRLPIRPAMIPGSKQVYSFSSNTWKNRVEGESIVVPAIGSSGRLVSVLRKSKRASSAGRRIRWICGKELGAKVSSESYHTSVFRKSQVGRAGSWFPERYSQVFADDYGSIMELSSESSLWLHSLRIPGRQEYMSALDDGIHAAIDGTDPKAALAEVVSKWNKITEKYGIERQKTAYSRSLGIE